MVRAELPYRVSERHGLPEPFAEVAPAADEIIFVPPQGFSSTWERLLRSRHIADSARALELGEDRLWILEEGERKINRRRIAFEDLLEVEIGNVLLHGWVAFKADGEDPIHIDFNAVVLSTFEDFVDGVLMKLRDDDQREDPGVLADLSSLDLKFRNAIRSRLLPGETLKTVTFGDAVWGRKALVLRRRLVAATALVLTDWRLLVVEEGEALRDTTYGSTACSIPLNRIATLAKTEDGLLVSFQTRREHCERQIPFSKPEGLTPVIQEATKGGSVGQS